MSPTSGFSVIARLVRIFLQKELEEQKTQPNPGARPGLPPSSNFSWLSDLLLRKLTQDDHEESHVTTQDDRVNLFDLQRQRQQRQEEDRQTAVNAALHDQELLSPIEHVKEYVWQFLTHKLRGAEGIRGSVVVETTRDDAQQTLFVKCYGPAVARAGEIRKLLEKPNHKLALEGFVLIVREESQPRIDFSLLWGPGTSDNIDSGSNLSDLAPMAEVPDQSSRQGITPGTAGYHETDRFANMPYWKSKSILVDCLFPRRPQLATNTLCGALVRMMSRGDQGESQLRTWTCGGIIHVNGVPYALTTAHPLIHNNLTNGQDGVGTTRPSVINDVFPASYYLPLGGKLNGMKGGQNWQTLGRVYHHAMSNGDLVPANCDWLLIDIAKDYRLPNFAADFDQHASPKLRSVSICTWRGSLPAKLLPGISFIILGQSSFKALKLLLDRPMMQGDSGSWVFKDGNAHGMVIAGSTEASGEHCAYAISMVDVCRQISFGMGNASVHVPTPIENAITAQKIVHKGRDTAELAALLIEQLVFEVAQEGSSTTESLLPNGVSTSGSVVNSLLALARVCPLARPGKDKSPIKERALALFLDNPVFSAFLDLFVPLTAIPGLLLPGLNLWHELRTYDALLNIDGLFRIVRSVDPGLDHGNIAKLIQLTMMELGIFPRPSVRQLLPILQSLHLQDQMSGKDRPLVSARYSRRQVYSKHRDELVSTPDLTADVPKVLARLLYAVSVHEFFVYCGALSQWLCDLPEVVELGVTEIHPGFGAASLLSQVKYEQHWASQIQAFVIPDGRLDHYSKGTGVHFSKYGDIIRHSELRGLLWRLENCERV